MKFTFIRTDVHYTEIEADSFEEACDLVADVSCFSDEVETEQGDWELHNETGEVSNG